MKFRRENALGLVIGAAGLAGGLATLPIGASAQVAENEATVLAYAAGYKAALICSATFSGGKTLILCVACLLDLTTGMVGFLTS